MDPYVYPNSSVLINKLNILDEQELIDVEAQLLIAGIIDIHSIMDDLDFRKYSSLQTIHRFYSKNSIHGLANFAQSTFIKVKEF